MNQIKVFAELHWAVVRPTLRFAINHTPIPAHCEIVQRENFVDWAVFSLEFSEFQDQNVLSIEMNNKTNDVITDQSDHWVDIVSIEINGIPADQTLLTNTRFEHHMPPSWCDEMQEQGIVIQDVYKPGTEIRLNGTCYFEFENPFLIQRIVQEWML